MGHFEDRLEQYARPLDKRNWQGAGRDEANIARWSARATENSDSYKHRGNSGPDITLPDTNKRDLRDTAMKPREARNADKRMVAKDDLNVVDSSDYLRGIRRQA